MSFRPWRRIQAVALSSDVGVVLALRLLVAKEIRDHRRDALHHDLVRGAAVEQQEVPVVENALGPLQCRDETRLRLGGADLPQGVDQHRPQPRVALHLPAPDREPAAVVLVAPGLEDRDDVRHGVVPERRQLLEGVLDRDLPLALRYGEELLEDRVVRTGRTRAVSGAQPLLDRTDLVLQLRDRLRVWLAGDRNPLASRGCRHRVGSPRLRSARVIVGLRGEEHRRDHARRDRQADG